MIDFKQRIAVGLMCIAPMLCTQTLFAAPSRQAHIYVALVDNQYQGIVPVPQAIGNGDDPKNNLYWGARYGIKTFLSTAAGWKRVSCKSNLTEKILERCEFRYGDQLSVIADAYRGRSIGQAMLDFMIAAAQPNPKMVMYVGHNGLMEQQHQYLYQRFPKAVSHQTHAAVLACKSHRYFAQPLQQAGISNMVTTYSFMAPEAYVAEGILRAYAQGQSSTQQGLNASQAYAKYQKISLKSAKSVFGAK